MGSCPEFRREAGSGPAPAREVHAIDTSVTVLAAQERGESTTSGLGTHEGAKRKAAPRRVSQKSADKDSIKAGTPRRIPRPGQFVVPLGGLRGVIEDSTISSWERSNWRGRSPGPLREGLRRTYRGPSGVGWSVTDK